MNVSISLFAWRKFFDRWMGLFFGIHRKCISLKARGTLRSHSIWRCSEFFSSARINRFVTQTAKMKAIISPTENGWDQYFDYMFHFLSILDRHFTYVGWRWVLYLIFTLTVKVSVLLYMKKEITFRKFTESNLPW